MHPPQPASYLIRFKILPADVNWHVGCRALQHPDANHGGVPGSCPAMRGPFSELLNESNLILHAYRYDAP
jgi:hypothetical protein